MGYIVNSKIVSELFEDEAVVVNLESGSYYSLRSAAFSIWKMIEAGYNRDQIINNCEQPQSCAPFLDYIINEALALVDENASSDTPDSKITGVPDYTKYEDMKDLLLLDPIHEVDQKGWPNKMTE